MSGQIYALLIGINDYPSNVGALTGCVNDVDHFHDYLTDTFDRNRLQIQVLKNADATRGNVITQFRSHLGKAKAGDVALFQYCGHGARDEKNVLTIKLVACETPFYTTLTLKYDGDQLLFDAKHNVAFGPTDLPQLLGKRVAE
jgi:hypothetical protein